MDKEKGFSWKSLRHKIFGKPIATAHAHHERLGPFLGLPVFSSDALSSVAYATEAILSILILHSVGALHLQIWLSLCICVLILLISFAYNQTIHAYPKGGGSYIVASDNLGTPPGLVAGAALMTDYILTVAVSISAGTAALTSAFPALHPYLVEISLFFIAVVAWANLRGMRESGIAFAIPTYSFVIGMLALLIVGFFRTVGASGGIPHVVAHDVQKNLVGAEWTIPMWFLILRAFAAGCTALTGIEAVSDGVQAFRPPESKNAARTLQMMAGILTVIFLGLGYISQHLPHLELHSTRSDDYRTLVSQIAAWTFGKDSFGFYYVQFATAAILILAANTAFADFPRLSSFLARDGFLPRPMARLGDRLVFHNGIIVLAVVAGGLVTYFHGELDQLLPLYAVGVFTAFTLSQAGMFRHWQKLRGRGWQYKATINGVGTILCFCVLSIILATKFLEGAWIVVVILPILVASFLMVKSRYNAIARQLTVLPEKIPPKPHHHTSLLLVPRVHLGIVSALEYALLLDPHCRAVHVAINERALPEVRRAWEKFGEGVPLTILPTPHRSLVQPVLDFIDEMLEEDPDQVITVIVSEAVSRKIWHRLLQENVAHQLRTALAQRKNVMVTNVRYFLE
ncbi:MAG TPA: APC family permease [Fimbriimonadaceae bacterium]|nr:APC family permease [Fimbriimonadaceae bacterium]